MSIRDISPENSLIALPCVQRFARASDGLVVTPVLGKLGVTEALLGSDGSTVAEFPSLARPRGFEFDGGDSVNLGNVGSFAGAGPSDKPFSCAAWVQHTAVTSTRFIWRKGRQFKVDNEWDFSIHGALEEVYIHCHDIPSGGFIGRSAQLDRGISFAVCATYDGSMTNSGFRIYDRTGRVDDSDDDFGVYEGMIDAGADLRVGEAMIGDISTPMIFDYALSEAEAVALCQRIAYIYNITP